MLVKIGVCVEQELVFYFDRLGVTFGVFEELFRSAPKTHPYDFSIYPLQEIDAAPDECVFNLASLYANSFGIQRDNQLFFDVASPALLYLNDMFYIEDEELTFASLAKWLDLEKTLFLLVINGDAGELFRGKYPGYTFTLRSRERNHHVPHIHVDYRHERSGSLRIEDGEMFEGGTLRKSEIRVAKQVILENKELLENAWDKLKLGLSQNLDLALGNELIHQVE
ncbi:DUF4160 domain-containing protein [uncultured Adlercreutzia sp.]|uniref:DUF4160 domain-containing protein n=1 Tax=uncultured Adlercreutzia sp. TaxID=875803 RepID=UPI0026F3F99E|nr:DUF4160 domain-containing protein [uncultured Adlercreutzia sp.]